jgi:hypothetical protein
MALSLRRRTSAQRQAQHLEFRHDALQGHTQPVPEADAMGGLHALGIQVVG